jgi:hypothetical protein
MALVKGKGHGMNWVKVAALAIGALLAFLVVGAVVHVITALLGYAVIAAIIGGGGYVAYRLATAGRGRQVRGRGRRRDRELGDDHRPRDSGPRGHGQGGYAAPPQPSRPDVDDELSRIKREMGH